MGFPSTAAAFSSSMCSLALFIFYRHYYGIVYTILKIYGSYTEAVMMLLEQLKKHELNLREK